MTQRATIERDANGVPHIQADCLVDLYWGQGVVHAADRGLQILFMRILTQGRISELLDDSETSVRFDTFFRRMNWGADADAQTRRMAPDAAECLAAYCDGVNHVLQRSIPWELKWLGYRPEPWRPEDTIGLSRLISYLGLQQSQAQMERLLVEMVQAGVAREKLEELFPGALDGADLELIRQVRLQQRIIPPEIIWQTGAPRVIASNNWVLAPGKTVSGMPLLCNDPHLEGNRLPNVWAEVVLRMGDRYVMGGSMPGGPGVMVGRNADVAWGATYAFVDAVDSWIEKCRDGKYYREPGQWLPLRTRTEIIRRKKSDPVRLQFYENDHGVLDGDPTQEGLYLATRWAADRSGAAAISSILEMWRVQNVEQGMDVLGRMETAWSFVLADRAGNIGFQMSGLLPLRRAGVSGAAPLPGWKAENDWRGFADPRDLPRTLNSPEGFLATANHDLNHYGRLRPINLCMGPYRADRIGEWLRAERRFAPRDMFEMQYDVYSPQAARFMEILRPLLPDTPQADVLRQWDLKYDEQSRGAYLFEQFYLRLVADVFGQRGLGREVIERLLQGSSLFLVFFHHFDRILLSEQSAWFAGRSREELFRRSAVAALQCPPRPWREGREYLLKHLLLGGKLPRLFGFDRGPVVAIGGRATIHQGQIADVDDRTTTFVPSYRLVADLSCEGLLTNLEGGPSDRRLSRWYCSDLKNWLAGRYKPLVPDPPRPRPFPEAEDKQPQGNYHEEHEGHEAGDLSKLASSCSSCSSW